MVTPGTQVFDQIVGFLVPFMGTTLERRTRIDRLFINAPKRPPIDYEGAAEVVTQRIVIALAEHDKKMLAALLGSLRPEVGENRQVEIHKLIALVPTITVPPSPKTLQELKILLEEAERANAHIYKQVRDARQTLRDFGDRHNNKAPQQQFLTLTVPLLIIISLGAIVAVYSPLLGIGGGVAAFVFWLWLRPRFIPTPNDEPLRRTLAELEAKQSAAARKVESLRDQIRNWSKP